MIGGGFGIMSSFFCAIMVAILGIYLPSQAGRQASSSSTIGYCSTLTKFCGAVEASSSGKLGWSLFSMKNYNFHPNFPNIDAKSRFYCGPPAMLFLYVKHPFFVPHSFLTRGNIVGSSHCCMDRKKRDT